MNGMPHSAPSALASAQAAPITCRSVHIVAHLPLRYTLPALNKRTRRATFGIPRSCNTGVQVSEIGFGGGGNAGLMVRGTPEQQRDAAARAIELGINYFDQAPDYGDRVSETNLGRLMKELSFRPYITTKVEVRAENLDDIAGHVTRSLDESLKCLGVDYVDFLQIHNGAQMERPELSGRTYTWLWIEEYLRPGGALEGLQRAQQSGKARFIGFITRGGDGEAARQLIDTGVFSLINVSVNLLNPSAGMKPYGMRVGADYDGILNYAAAHGVGASVYAPLAGGFLNDNAVEGGGSHPLAQGPRTPAAAKEGLRRARGAGVPVAEPQSRHPGGRPQPGGGRGTFRPLAQRGVDGARRLL